MYADLSTRSLFSCGLEVLRTSCAEAKAAKTRAFAAAWKAGTISATSLPGDDLAGVPESPARPAYVKIASKNDKMKQGNRKAFAHSVAHAESYAIDLMWDMVCRFGPSNDMPKAFFDDFVRIADEEAQHYRSWASRLKDFDSFYGDLPGHDGLWDSARETSSDILSRLALVHLVHEARGLDTYPMAVARFTKSNDTTTLTFMEKNHKEEVTHVAAGLRWFQYLCEKQGGLDPIPTFHDLVRAHYVGVLKPPFNTAARDRALMTEAWYMPLTEPA
ncbi:hypothetical protein SPRG_04502 [Saprolegnia parasitica CBS 223.65]|uniref:DUF455 domain-containing protein n=1 Tax=Saprolegnia parasitica (strain CBS 223.65) TaxID=695850 RepID=A0A067CJA9_SAPPC|nr:hypothetical protein SPRG_04502 [Saprolegnia parasitica CBS 223.65]KDO30603.1 hypothetical protein SPRG_04502 [Saprolegnia parasitica CBS 223.65]|eukprot:XP_012198814.1 hypothetical protein SPRG_04502 [Saprolegnia parasitica CBS 223.65]